MKKDNVYGALSAIVAFLLVLVPTVNAWSQQDEAANRTGVTVIEQIIVTGEKRDVDLQRAPFAISAVTSDQLDTQSVFNVTGMTARVPGLVINKSEGTDRTITLRGLGKSGSTQNGLVRQSVAYHQDGVYYRNTLATNQDFFDVERVEIIRGPTGTVYGQSSVGGVINVITKRPELGEHYGYADFTLGNEGHLGGRFYANVPVSDSVALRASAEHRSHDGYFRNVFLGKDLDEEDNTSGKIQLLYKPNDDFELLLRAARFEIAENNGRAQKGLLDTTPGHRNLNQNFPGLFSFDMEDFSAEINYSTKWFDIKSITAKQDADNLSRSDNDRANLAVDARPGYVTDNRILNFQQDRSQFSQEITLSSNADGAFSWILGTYYLDTDAQIEFIEGLDDDQNGVIPDWDQIRNVDEKLLLPGNDGLVYRGIENGDSLAVFAHLTYQVSDNLEVFAGVRRQEDESNLTASFFFGKFDPRPSTELETTDYKIGVNYDVSDDAFVYLTYAKGTKPNGGSLTGTGTGEAAKVTLENFRVPKTFKEEENEAIEVGLKLMAFDDRLQVNSAVYAYDVSNYQFLSDNPRPFEGGAVNVPSVDMWGIESEIKYLVTDNFQIDFSVGYLDTEINGFTPALDTIKANEATAASRRAGLGRFSDENIAARQKMVEDLDGNILPAAPELTYNISANYTMQLAQGALDLNLNYSYRDEFFARIYNDPVADSVPSLGLLGATISYEPSNANWKLQLISSNLTDKEHVNNTYTDIFGVGATGQEFGAPRLFMGRLSVNFQLLSGYLPESCKI